MQKLDDELQRSFVVIVKGDLEVAGLGANIVHEITPMIDRYWESSLGLQNWKLEHNMNNVTPPCAINRTPVIALLL
jgi:hypothetical protein